MAAASCGSTSFLGEAAGARTGVPQGVPLGVPAGEAVKLAERLHAVDCSSLSGDSADSCFGVPMVKVARFGEAVLDTSLVT